MTSHTSLEEGARLSLSSGLTPLYKLGATTVTAGAAALLFVASAVAKDPALLIAAAVATLLATYVFLYCGRIKTVVLHGHTLHISTLRTTVSVPLQRLLDIEIKRLFYPPLAFLHFDGPTAAGRVVQFMPDGVRLLRDNPELQRVVYLASTLRAADTDPQQS